MYEVIHFFTDLQDFDHPYNVGDIFPRDGLKVADVRLKELMGNHNRQRKPLIKPVKDNSMENSRSGNLSKHTKTYINKMSTAQLQDLATREGISDISGKSDGELKKNLIQHFGL